MIPDPIIDLMEMFKVTSLYFKNGTLAGGAPRDLMNDKPVKDWDFFFDIVYKPLSDSGKLMVKQHMADVGFYPNKEIISSEYPESTWEVVDYIEPKSKTSVQLIWSRDTIHQFDHSSCMIEYDYVNQRLITNELYDWTMENKIHLLLVNNFMTNYQVEKAVRSHTNRISIKYPWPVILKNVSTIYTRTSEGRMKIIKEVEESLNHVRR